MDASDLRLATCLRSEVQSKLCLELTAEIGLRSRPGDGAEVGLVDIQQRAVQSRRKVRLRMVEYVGRIQPDLKAL